MAFADPIWDTTISSLAFDLLGSAILIDSYEQSSAGTQAHRLSLIGISTLQMSDQVGGETMTVAEIRDFGVDARADGLLFVEINISDQIDLQVVCRDAVFDEVAFAEHASNAPRTPS